MPYNSTRELPMAIKSNLPSHAQLIFKDAFNAAWNGTCSKRKDREQCCVKIAWKAVENSYHKNKDGKWVKNDQKSV